ncbi:MAG: hypothetical protein H8E38_09340 [SAR324 cluster bacterium]|nr:hypothetical protein [SAR324 cluster bacterium]
MFLSIDKSIPCGLIVNELIMNSLRHAFPEGRDGKIKVLLHQNDEDEIEIVVNDNGVGMKDDLNFSETKSLGLSIIKILVRQLKGEITQDNIAGTEFRVKFSI